MKPAPFRLALSILAAITLVLSACGSSPAVRYFQLAPTTDSDGQPHSQARRIAIGPLQLAGYLDRPQLVQRAQGQELVVHEFLRWAAPLDDAITRVIAQNISARNPALLALTTPSPTAGKPQLRLTGTVLRFDSSADGQVVLEVYWQLADTGTDRIVSEQTSRYTHSVGDPEDISTVLAAMNRLLARFSGDIAAAAGDG